jgi:rRNA processing protein Gar1
MDFKFIGDTIDVIGKLMIAYTAIMVHYRVRKEHKVDDVVFMEMRKEHIIAILGAFLIVGGYIMRNFIG